MLSLMEENWISYLLELCPSRELLTDHISWCWLLSSLPLTYVPSESVWTITSPLGMVSFGGLPWLLPLIHRQAGRLWFTSLQGFPDNWATLNQHHLAITSPPPRQARADVSLAWAPVDCLGFWRRLSWLPVPQRATKASCQNRHLAQKLSPGENTSILLPFDHDFQLSRKAQFNTKSSMEQRRLGESAPWMVLQNVSPAICFCLGRSEEMWVLGSQTLSFFIQVFIRYHQWVSGECLTTGFPKKSDFNLRHLPISVV